MNIQKSSADLYAAYKETTQKAADLNNASAVLGWDQEVYMPAKGFEVRGRQLATLASLAHEMLTSEAYGNQLQELAGRGDLADDEKRNVELSLEDYNKNKKLSAAFVEAITQQTSASYNAWIQSRKENKFSIYAPELDKMIQLKKQQASMYGYESNPYNALLDEYEKGASVALLDRVFGDVKQQLPVLLDKIKAALQVDDSFFLRNYPKQSQWEFSIDVLRAMGYDFEAGRQDMSEHPFTTSFAPTDVRVTTRVDENNYSSLLWSSIHEGGHALYEQGLPIEQYGLPLGAAASLGIHESQSRLWENNVGRGKQFWHHFYPKLQQYFPQQLNDVSVEAFYKGMNKVEPSLIRTEADEVTYHFHVMIRYEIEKGLMNGDLFTEDLPEAWNGLYNKYLGVSAQDDKTGVLQDVHWAHGSFGYFPTYSLGSFYAAQFYQQAVKEMPTLADDIANGRLLGLREWLRGKVHQYGRRYTSEELCKQITGTGLDFKVFMQYAHEKYAGIYGF
ncbi:MAG TPA: carboxypeptidase M32 [Flavipsychrobacter sp.]|nr:carboxypeptidase M32 [Flavipsychrobacter sp.]